MQDIIKVRTIEARHVNQLHWIHDEDYSFDGKTILGRFDGALIVQNQSGNLDRVSVTVWFMQQMVKESGPGSHARITAQLKQIPQLFEDSRY